MDVEDADNRKDESANISSSRSADYQVQTAPKPWKKIFTSRLQDDSIFFTRENNRNTFVIHPESSFVIV